MEIEGIGVALRFLKLVIVKWYLEKNEYGSADVAVGNGWVLEEKRGFGRREAAAIFLEKGQRGSENWC